MAASIVIIGAGPAGLTTSYALAKRGIASTTLEADGQVGGLSRTVERDGYRFDIGGHRFFTRVPEVEQLWDELLEPNEFIWCHRVSRILYEGRMFDYPLRASNALRNLGYLESARCLASYLRASLFPPADRSTFEGWVTARFGRQLYERFFKTYTEKVWGIPAANIQADWAAQRIKNLSLSKAAFHALTPWRPMTDVTSLIKFFRYPVRGPGMMWERAAQMASALGARVMLGSPVSTLYRDEGGVHTVRVRGGPQSADYPATHVVSSMPLAELVTALEPPAPPRVRAAAARLRYRDFITVALVVPERCGFPDNWIYVHTPGVRVGRIQNFGSWSRAMVKDGTTCLGMEYFVSAGDQLWSATDQSLTSFAADELVSLGLASPDEVLAGYVTRVRKAYPVYDPDYSENVNIIRSWLAHEVRNVYPVGRNGMHRYNNQDHSMYTALLTVENIVDGTDHDVWSVNVDRIYAEEKIVAATAGRQPVRFG